MLLQQFLELLLFLFRETRTANLGGVTGNVQLDVFSFLEISVRIRAQKVCYALSFAFLGYERVFTEELSCSVELSEFIKADFHADHLLDIFRQSLMVCRFTQAAIDFAKSLMAVDAVGIYEVSSLDKPVLKVFPTDARVFLIF